MQHTVTTQESSFEVFLAKRSEPKWLVDYRRKNFEVFLAKPLKKSKYINVQKIEELLKPSAEKSPLPRCIGEGIEVLPFEDALQKHPEKIRQAIESESPPKDQFEAFINAFFESGSVVFFGKDTGDEAMLELEALDGSIAKNFLFFENEKKTIVLEKIKGTGFFCLSENVHLAESASAEVCRLHLHDKDSTGLFYNQSTVLGNAELVNSNAWLDGKMLRSNTFNNLCGAGASAKQFDALFLSENQLFDLNNTAMHLQTDSKSNTVFGGVVSGKSKSVFDAMIKIVKSAQRSNAFLEAHSMLLSPFASSNNIPGLEIEADDVRATHSASVAQVEEEQVYYLESRGIPKEQAIKMIIDGFLESVLLNLDERLGKKVFMEFERKTSMLGNQNV